MLIVLREVIASILFCAALFGLYQMLLGVNPIQMALISIALFLLAFWIWPSKRKGQRDEDYWFLEYILEFIIELPIDVLKFVFRLLFKSSSKSDGGIDIDL